MIVERISRPETAVHDELVVVTQNDHAAFAADLLALFPALKGHPQRASLLRAARLHDLGWAELDSAPLLDSRGLPHDFLSLPTNARLDLWQRAVERLRSEPLIASLVAEHALFVLGGPAGHRAEVAKVTTWLEEFIENQLGEVAQTRKQIVALHGWIRVVDALSLVACGAWAQALTIAGIGEALPELTAVREAPARLTIDPLPLIGPSRVTLRYRNIPARRYRSTTDLVTELATSSWRQRAVQITGSRSESC